jgi:hypothetical protein
MNGGRFYYVNEGNGKIRCSLLDFETGERIYGKEAFEKAKELGALIVHCNGTDSCGEIENIYEKDFEFSMNEAKKEEVKKYLVILNFDRNLGILFEKYFNEKGNLHLKKNTKGTTDEVLDVTYELAFDPINEINYQIVVEQEESPVVFESGYITPDGDLIPKRSEEEDELNDEKKNPIPLPELPKKEDENLNESIENDEKFDWYLEYRNKNDIILYADEREDFIETDRYPKHKEFEDKNALNRARKLLKDGLQGGIGVSKGSGARRTEGFLRLGEDGKTLMIEIESKGSRNGTLVPLI